MVRLVFVGLLLINSQFNSELRKQNSELGLLNNLGFVFQIGIF